MEQAAHTWRLERDRSGSVTLWFDRPGSAQNSLGSATFEELQQHLRAIADDQAIRSLVVRSGKPRGFCAGADLKQLATCREVEEALALMHEGWAALNALMALPIPTVALIHGVCLGGGLELALACRERYVVAGEGMAEARLGSPEVLLGLVPSWGAIATLPRLVGLPAALDLLIGGQPIGAEQALSIGLVSRVIAPEETSKEWSEPPAGAAAPPWPPADWTETLEARRRGLPDDREGPTLARHRLLDVLALELTDGPEAGRSAAILALAELAMTPAARAALDAFCNRRSIS